MIAMLSKELPERATLSVTSMARTSTLPLNRVGDRMMYDANGHDPRTG